MVTREAMPKAKKSTRKQVQLIFFQTYHSNNIQYSIYYNTTIQYLIKIREIKSTVEGVLQILSPTLKILPEHQEERLVAGSHPRSPPTTWCTWAPTHLPSRLTETIITKATATIFFNPAIIMTTKPKTVLAFPSLYLLKWQIKR